MPSVNVRILAQGPVLDVHVGVSEPRRKALVNAGLPVPLAVPCRLLIDTGASVTCVDPWIPQNLGLTPSGMTHIHTPSTAQQPHVCQQYDVSLTLPHPAINRIFSTIPVIESSLTHQGIDELMGRDILAHCLLIYNGELGVYTLSF